VRARADGGPCLGAGSQGRLHLSVEGGQEFLFHRLHVGSREAAVREFDALEGMVVWHPFDLETLRAPRDLIAPRLLRGRDAVHAATAMQVGFEAILSADGDFDGCRAFGGSIRPSTGRSESGAGACLAGAMDIEQITRLVEDLGGVVVQRPGPGTGHPRSPGVTPSSPTPPTVPSRRGSRSPRS
jgi:hypothetical protein